MIRELRRARLAFGDGVKHRRKCEEKALYKIGKKLVASRDLPVGHVLIYEDLAIKSPNDGLPPYELENVIGLTLISELEQDQNIEFKNLSDC